MVAEGDIMFYADNETVLNEDFLSVNNQYTDKEFDRNANANEVGKLLTQLAALRTQYDECISALRKIEDSESDEFKQLREKADKINLDAEKIEGEIKTNTGFFTKQSRVRMIKLRGVPSMGYLFGVDSMEKFCPEIKDENLEEYVGQDFDTVNGVKFIEVYIPKKNEPSQRSSKEGKRQKKIEKFDKMIPGQFAFHYDTFPLGKNIDRIKPDDTVTVSVKVHGTSAIYANILTKKPKDIKTPFKWLDVICNKVYHALPFKWQKTENVYDHIYSSRTVIKNQYINHDVTGGYYGRDIWGEYNDLLKDFIPEGMTVYGEIFGYMTNSQTMIQKNYDYGCPVGHNKFMPYRITTMNEDGTKREWEVTEVHEWTVNLMNEHPEVADRLFPIEILYVGKLGDLYQLDVRNHWHENVLNKMANEKRWLMERRETLCTNKVPREGIVLRIVGDPVKEAFKLKTNAFALQERDLIDQGEMDMEMTENYGN